MAGPEARDARADRLDGSRNVPAADSDLRSAEPDRETSHVGQTGHQVPHVRATAGRAHANEHVPVTRDRIVDVPELQDVG